jgi:glyceraldehyde-3-phosphate dehydrogenase/erythrose-4-phosphate dehydrogenase
MTVRVGINGFGRMGRLALRASPSTRAPGDVPWADLGVDVVLECSGKFRTAATLLEPYFAGGVARSSWPPR